MCSQHTIVSRLTLFSFNTWTFFKTTSNSVINTFWRRNITNSFETYSTSSTIVIIILTFTRTININGFITIFCYMICTWYFRNNILTITKLTTISFISTLFTSITSISSSIIFSFITIFSIYTIFRTSW